MSLSIGDGTPDVWDQDNDNDGVPDSIDGSPMTAMGGGVTNGAITGFSEQTFNFQLSDITPKRTTSVDFQLRPVNPTHLTYAMNVLDWPSNDRAGQIQRVSDSTFRTLNGDSQASDPKDSNGDVRLVPMLEIEIPYQQGTGGGLPTKCSQGAPDCPKPLTETNAKDWLNSWLDTAEMNKYGLAVQPKDSNGTLLVYVPLNVVRDPVGDTPVAFSGRMVYRLTSTFGKSQKVRLAWTVQAINDQCTEVSEDFKKDEEAEKRYDEWCKDTTHWTSATSIVHTYYDDWYLTSFAVNEEQPLTVGLIYQPYKPQTYNYDSALWTVAQGLEKSFLANRSDLPFSAIKDRFDSQSNSKSTDEQRWGIPKDKLRMYVETFNDETGMAQFSLKYNKQILQESFGGATDASLLYLQSQTARVAGLDSGADGNNLTTLVTADPFNPDTDGDKLTDYREMVFGTNPRVWSDPEVVKISSEIDDTDGYVKPGQVLNYTAQIANKMLNREVRGLLEVDFPPAVQDVRLQAKPFFLGPNKQIELKGSVQVKPDAATQKLNFVNRASSFISNPQAGAATTQVRNGPKDDYVLRFDEPPASNFFKMGGRETDFIFSCTDLCPASGLPGIYDQAIRLDAKSTVGSNSNLTEMASFGVWINPSIQSSADATVIKFTTLRGRNTVTVYHLGYDGTKQQVFGQSVGPDGKTNNSYHKAIVPPGKWAFVSFDFSFEVDKDDLNKNNNRTESLFMYTLAVNGAEQKFYSPAGDPAAQSYTPVIGGGSASFVGLLDHFIIRRKTKYVIPFEEPKDSKTVKMIGYGAVESQLLKWQTGDNVLLGKPGREGLAIRPTKELAIEGNPTVVPPLKDVSFWIKPKKKLFKIGIKQTIMSFYSGASKLLASLEYRDEKERTICYLYSDQSNKQKEVCTKNFASPSEEFYTGDIVDQEDLCWLNVQLHLTGDSKTGYLKVATVDKCEVTTKKSKVSYSVDSTAPLGASFSANSDLRLSSESGNGFTGLIDQVIIEPQEIGKSSQGMIDKVPQVMLHLDEPVGSTTFANANSKANLEAVCGGNGCPLVETKGQVRKAVEFHKDKWKYLELPASRMGCNQAVGMWVKPSAKVGGYQSLFKTVPAADGNDYYPLLMLGLDKDLYPILNEGAGKLRSTSPIRLNDWSYLVAEIASEDSLNFVLKLYQQGTLAGKQNFKRFWGDDCPSGNRSDFITLIGKSFAGTIDEVTLFTDDGSLQTLPNDSEVAGTFNYQGSWWDAETSHQVIIDADKPTVKLDFSAPHIAKRDIVLPIVAQDATSGIEKVEYQLTENGAWLSANLNEGIWSFTYTPKVVGKQKLTVRATDLVGNSTTQSAELTVDDVAPQVSFDDAESKAPRPFKVDSTKGTWIINLAGKVTDNGTNDSGVQSLTVTVLDKNGGYIGKSQTLQTIEKDGKWKVDYELGLKPDGLYPVRLEAVDKVGNLSSSDFTIALDTTAPYADLTTTSNSNDAQGNPVPNTFAGTGSKLPLIEGSLSDLPYQSNASLTMHFEEAAGATLFRDSSANHLRGTCSGNSCPQAQTSGKYGNGLTFAGDDMVTFSEGEAYRQTEALLTTNPKAYPQAVPLPSKDLTVATWVSVKQQNNLDGFISALQATGGTEKGWMLGSRNGRFTFGLASTEADDGDGFLTYLEAPETYTPGQWYYVVGTYDGATMRIYVDGELKATSTVQTGDILYPASAWFGLGAYRDGDEDYRFKGLLDEVMIYDRALSSDEIKMLLVPTSGVASLDIALQHTRDRLANAPLNWNNIPLNLSQSSPTYTTWRYQLPEGLEGIYTIALRTTDKLGNSQVIPNVWQGMLDTQAPRVSFTDAEDFNIDESKFSSPCGKGIVTRRENYAEAWYKEAFATVDKDGNKIPASERLYRIGAFCTASTAIGGIEEVGFLPQKDVGVGGKYGYLLNDLGFTVADLTDPTNPQQVAEYTSKPGGYDTVSLNLAAKDAFLLRLFGGFDIVDISDPTKPVLKGQIDETTSEVFATDKYAIFKPTFDSRTAFAVVDLANPTKGIIGRYTAKGFGVVAVSQNLVYISDGLTLKVIDLTDTANVKTVGSYRAPSGAKRYAIGPNYLFVAVGTKGLDVYRIPEATTSLANLSLLGNYPTPGAATSVTAGGDTAYVIDNKNNVSVIRPSAPNKKATYRISDPALRVMVTDPYTLIYVQYSTGLRVLKLSDSAQSIPFQTTACDLLGNCTIQSATMVSALSTAMASDSAPPMLQEEASPPIFITVGSVPEVLKESLPLDFTASFQAETGLKDVTISVDGNTLTTQSWASSDVVTETIITTPTFTPTVEGRYTLVVQATDHHGATVQDTKTSFVLDTQAPTISTNKAALNLQDVVGSNFSLRGVVTDTASLEAVEVMVESAQSFEKLPVTFTDAAGNALTLPITFANNATPGQLQWQAPLSFDGVLPDGLKATATLTVTDQAGHQKVLHQPLNIDGVAPTLGEVTLGYKVNDQTTVITPGLTVADERDPEMVINWESASDLSNIKRYLAGWTTSPTPTIAALTSYGPVTTSHTQKVSDGPKWYAHLVAEDGAGNQTTLTLGPIYVDYAPTPSYISMQENGIFPYRSWSDSKCSLVGTDNRINERSNGLASLKDGQKLYTTWNHEGLRLMWTGANWDTDGDLFIYLDTKVGGSSQLYDPYPATITNTAILLPPLNDLTSLAGVQAKPTLQGSSPRSLPRLRLSATKGSMFPQEPFLLKVQPAFA